MPLYLYLLAPPPERLRRRWIGVLLGALLIASGALRADPGGDLVEEALAGGATVAPLEMDSVFEEHGVVMLLIDPETGAIERANPAAEDFYGYPPGTLENLSIDAINTFTPAQVAEERARAEEAERNYFIFRHRLANDDIRKVEVVSHPYRVNDRILLLSMIRDATPAATDEGDLLHYQTQLEQQVDEQVARVERIHRGIVQGLVVVIALLLGIITYLMYVVRKRHEAEEAAQRHTRQLARAHDELRRFAEIAAHHLVEPARRLVSYAGKLRGDIPEAGRSEAVAFDLEAIERSARRQRDLVNDIQRYLAAGDPGQAPEWLDTRQVLADMLSEHQRRLEQRGGRLEVGELPMVYLDPGRLRQMVGVLLDNAEEHAAIGTAPVVRIGGERTDERFRLWVEDNGPGIEPAMRERALRLFERLRHDGEGTGIGLPLARRIVESVGGWIALEASEQGGTRVTLEWPVPEG